MKNSTDLLSHEGVPLMRTSTRTSFARCQQQWKWSWLDSLESNDPSTALRFGTLAHKALERWYIPGLKRGEHPAETWDEVYHTEAEKHGDMGVYDEDTGGMADAYELGVQMMEDYVECYGTEPWLEIVAVEQPFEILITSGGEPVCIYCGTFDAIGYDHEELCYLVLEHKTAATISTRHLALDEQANSYWAFSSYWLNDNYDEDAELNHILYNFMRKGKRDDRPTNAQGQALNKDGSVSKRQPPPRYHRERVFRGPYERHKVLERIVKQATAIEWVRENPEELYKTPGSGPQSHCNWCAFQDACELEESMADWEEMLKMTTRPWDPFEGHRPQLEGVSLDQMTTIEVEI